MHPIAAARSEQARVRHARLLGVAGLLFAALAVAGAVVAETPVSRAPMVAFGAAAAHAAESPRADRGQDPKAAARKKARAPRDTAFGREGDPRKAKRVIKIEMSDAMRYFPDHVSVKKGDTVRFNVRNAGELPHEMVLGTMDDLKKHAETIRKHGEMTHHDANVAHVNPGETGRIVWQFTRAGEFYYGCLVPGHFDAGMIGTIVVR